MRQCHEQVQASLLSDSLDVVDWASAYAVRDQLDSGGEEARRIIARNWLCAKVLISTDAMDFQQHNSISGKTSVDVSIFKLRGISPRLQRKNSPLQTSKFLVRVQMTQGWVNHQEQFLKIVDGFDARKFYKVLSDLHGFFPAGTCTINFWIMFDNSDGPASNQVNPNPLALDPNPNPNPKPQTR